MNAPNGQVQGVRHASWLQSRLPTRESIVVVALLAVIFHLAYLAAFLVRGELLLRPSDARMIVSTIGYVIAIKLVVFYARGLAHRPWRAARFHDLNKLIRAATAAMLVLVAYNYFGHLIIPSHVVIPRSVMLLDWAFTVLGVGGLQALARSVHEELMPATPAAQKVVLIVDASEQGRRLSVDLAATSFVAGFLDDTPQHYGEQFGSVRVLGPISMAPACAERLRATNIVVCEGSVFGERLRSLCDACSASGVRVSVAEIPKCLDRDTSARDPQRTPSGFRLREVELRDLLSRPQANLADKDAHVLPFLRNKSVLVTGAGGSIGSEICRQIMRFRPARLVLVERSEYSLFAIHRELTQLYTDSEAAIVPVLADIANVDRADRLFADYSPQVVIHAAAFKHVPLMEGHPVEAVENNTLATVALAEVADTHGVEVFVALSTDKAVNPTSIMGASKLVAERFLQAFGRASRTRFVSVRFGNVLGSSGSAVPIFQEQLTKGLPITITHPDVRRFFMTIDEAAQLVLFAGSISPSGGTCVLEMGESIRMVDLVNSLAFLMNLPKERVRIEYCGLRPGEKLDEELFFFDEHREATENPLVTSVSRPPRSIDEVRSWLAELKEAVSTDSLATANTLMRIVTEDCTTARGGGVASLERSSHNSPVPQAASWHADSAGASGEFRLT